MIHSQLTTIATYWRRSLLLGISLLVLTLSLAAPMTASAGTTCGDDKNGNQHVKTAIDLGCSGRGNPIMDMLFAFIRFLSTGAGLVIVASLVYAGIQYTGSRGDPNANALAVKRIQANVVALLMFIFAYAIINYVVPGAFLK